MSLVYNFSFAPPAAGLTCTVTDETGATVATGTVGTEVGLDGAVVFSAALAEGNYTGSVSDAAFGEWHEVGVLDVPDSLTAGGGGGFLLDSDALTVEINDGTTLPLDGGSLTFDTLPDGIALDGTHIVGIEPGVYAALVEIDLDAPAEDRTITVNINSSLSPNSAVLNGPCYIGSDTSSWRGTTAMAAGVIVVAETATVTVSIRGDVVNHTDNPTPADWSILYVGMFLTKIG